MILEVIIDDHLYPLDVPQHVLQGGEGFFAKMDQDMDQGWQMGRDWVDAPDVTDRCRIAADKMLTAFERDNEALAMMMGGYILSRMPGIRQVVVDTSGDVQMTQLIAG